jgi:lipoprotein-releasing system ATP-binding protein
MNDPLVLQATALHMSYTLGPTRVDVLKGVELDLQRAQQVAIVGASGSGKSTLLHCLGGLEKPSSGEVRLAGKTFSGLSEQARGRQRNRHIGFIYQFHHLLPEFSALENVAMPLLIGGQSAAVAGARALAVLERVGLGDRTRHKPAELSGGERQRCAIARALVTNPTCVFADEPTGNLDRATADNVYALLLDMNREQGTSFVIVTHDHALARRMDLILELHDGVLRPV